MNAYEQKQADRKERLEQRASGLVAESNQVFKKATQMASVIPFGQPIHVGHHSERSDRSYRGKISNKFEQAFKLQKEADEAAARAAAVGTGGISSDDPDAVVKLREQLVELETKQTKMKQENAIIAKNRKAGSVAQIAALIEAGVPEQWAHSLVNPQFAYMGQGHPKYRLSNNNANMRRIKLRIESLTARKAAVPETVEQEHNGFTLVQNVDENRVQFIFPGKPEEKVRDVLKMHGFRWAPSNGAWQRQLNGNGQYAARCVVEQLATMIP